MINQDINKKTILMFSGQGSQKVNMGSYYFENFKIAQEILTQASDISGYDLKSVIQDNESINDTKYSQIVISTVSIAILKSIKQELGIDTIENISSYVLGHSLGEYSALCAAGVISFEDNIKLLKNRSLLMNKSCQSNPGAMIALIYNDISKVYDLINFVQSKNTKKVISLANDNCDGQVVLSGHVEMVYFVNECFKDFNGIKKAIKLNVSGAFHSPLMKDAQDSMKDFIFNTKFNTPVVPIYQNFSSKPEIDIDTIKRNLVNQISNTVKFRESLNLIKHDNIVKNFIESSHGNIISGLVKKNITQEGVNIVSASNDIADVINLFANL